MNKVNSIANLLNSSNLNKSVESNKVSLSTNAIQDIPLDLIEFDESQPRQEFLDEEIEDIARTLIPVGSKINQPITTWPINDDGKYIIKFGEKRTRASRLANRETIPVIIDYRLDYNNETHRAINFAEQFVENKARSDLTGLDECVALAKLKNMFGNLKDVSNYIGAKSLGTISDKIKVSEIKTKPEYKFLLDLYNDTNLKFKDLTNLKKLIDVLRKNPNNFEDIKRNVIISVENGSFNRQWIETFSLVDFDNKATVETTVKNKAVKSKSKAIEDTSELGYQVRPPKKAKLMGSVTIDRKRRLCQLLLDRIDNEGGFVWVILEGETEPIRVNLSKLTLTEVS